MNIILTLAVIRLLAYALMAMYCLRFGRWVPWAVFTLLVFTTYAYAFNAVPILLVEVGRTLVAAGLIYITLRRK